MSGKIGKEGDNKQKGVIPHIIDDIFDEMHNVVTPTEFSIGVCSVCCPYG